MRGELIRRSPRHALVALAALIVLAWSAQAEAACTISASGINFGTYSVFSADAGRCHGDRHRGLHQR